MPLGKLAVAVDMDTLQATLLELWISGALVMVEISVL